VIDVTHKECGEVAFRLVVRPNPGDAMKSSIVRLLDGSIPEPHSIIVCGYCGKRFCPKTGDIATLDKS
jgi:hypothetical protein